MKYMLLIGVLFLAGCSSVNLYQKDGNTILKIGELGWGDLDCHVLNRYGGKLKEHTEYILVEVTELQEQKIEVENIKL